MSKNERLVLKDNIWGEITFDGEAKGFENLINTIEFRRLENIFQSPFLQQDNGSPKVTRNIHCIGVFELAQKWCKNQNVVNNSTEEERKEVMAAALLHDIGHGPFSHSFEKMCKDNFDHEEMGIKIIMEKEGGIYRALKGLKIKPERICAILSHNYHKAKKWQIKMISSQIDVDRLDYLTRDGKAINQKIGIEKKEVLEVIEKSRIDLNNGDLTFDKEVEEIIIKFLINRKKAYDEVYENIKATISNYEVERSLEIIRELYKTKKISIKDIPVSIRKIMDKFLKLGDEENFVKKIETKEFLTLNDATLITFLCDMKVLCDEKIIDNEELKKILNSFFGKKIFDGILSKSSDLEKNSKIISEQKNKIIMIKGGNKKEIYRNEKENKILFYNQKNELEELNKEYIDKEERKNIRNNVIIFEKKK